MNRSRRTVVTVLLPLFIISGLPAEAADSMALPGDVQPQGQGSSQAAPSRDESELVRGDILNIEGQIVFIKDVTGHEIQLKTDKNTKTDGVHKVGDKIEAAVTREGLVTSIRSVLPEESGPPRSVR
jgi:hypothetical protein